MHVQIWLKVAVKLRKKSPTTESGTLKGSWKEFQGEVGDYYRDIELHFIPTMNSTEVSKN